MSKTQYNLNQNIEQFLGEKTADDANFSVEDIAYVNQFTGYGGMAQFGPHTSNLDWL
ncbi:MAG: hypothetical protein ACI85O_002635 [Saprospiraceae bacterium]|jgi:hypothetical protein